MQVKDLKEVKKILLKYTILSINNFISNGIDKSLAKPSFLAQKVDVNSSDNKLVQGFINKDNKFNNSITNRLFYLLFLNAKTNS